MPFDGCCIVCKKLFIYRYKPVIPRKVCSVKCSKGIRFVDLDAYFRSRSTPKKDCWIWTGKTNRDGYGVLHREKRELQAHRYSYQFYKGEIPPGQCVLHSCDTPPCINPKHLWSGTQAENVRDMIYKGRFKGVSRQ